MRWPRSRTRCWLTPTACRPSGPSTFSRLRPTRRFPGPLSGWPRKRPSIIAACSCRDAADTARCSGVRPVCGTCCLPTARPFRSLPAPTWSTAGSTSSRCGCSATGRGMGSTRPASRSPVPFSVRARTTSWRSSASCACRTPSGRRPLAGTDADLRAEARQWTNLIFIDAFDPKPLMVPPLAAPPAEPALPPFPSEITLRYELTAPLKGPAPFSAQPAAVRLPVTTPPWQVPRMVSAGLALSPYESADDYSSTQSRRRMLWFEFAEAPVDPEDAYFVRVLATAPDNMLTESSAIAEVVEPALPIDQEWMRLITPGQPRDDNGLRAMQHIPGPAASPRHFLVPLPEGLNEASLELFGFFVYEIRLGHTDSRWCTAQGRFGPALRVAGVQHPAPPLVCHSARTLTDVLVRAPVRHAGARGPQRTADAAANADVGLALRPRAPGRCERLAQRPAAARAVVCAAPGQRSRGRRCARAVCGGSVSAGRCAPWAWRSSGCRPTRRSRPLPRSSSNSRPNRTRWVRTSGTGGYSGSHRSCRYLTPVEAGRVRGHRGRSQRSAPLTQMRIAREGSISEARRAGNQLAATTTISRTGSSRHQRERILRRHAEQQRAREAAAGGRTDHPDRPAGRGQRQRLQHDRPGDALRRGSQRHPQGDLTAPLRHGVGEQGIHTAGGRDRGRRPRRA